MRINGGLVYAYTLLLVATYCCVFVHAAKWNPWWGTSAPVFRSEGLHLYDTGLQSSAGFPSAFGDADNDKFSDVYMVEYDGSTVGLYEWHHDGYKFRRQGLGIGYPEHTIHSVIPTDVNYDGKMDLVVVRRIDPSFHGDAADHVYALDLFVQTSGGHYAGVGSLANTHGLPFVVDINGDMRIDFLYVDPASNVARVLLNTGGVTFRNATLEEFCANCIPQGFRLSRHMQHSHGFLDIDGDCVPDLALVLESDTAGELQVTFAVQAGRGRFVPATSVSLPAGALSITFGDVDADGNVDLVVPVCFPAATCYEEFSVHIIFNKQRAMCKTRDTSFFDSCRSERKLCSASPFSFDAVVGDGHSVLALKPPSNANPDFVVKSPYVPRVMLGDLDLDGFADMIFAHSGEVHFMRNVRSTVRHSFEESSFDSKLSKEIFSAMTDVVAATFIDLDESGMLDVMLVRGNPDSSSNYITETYVNNLFLDAFFLKTVGLNGICPAWCSDGPTFPDPKPYGVNMVGVTTKFVVTELDGSVSTATGVQLPQLGGNNLASPYAYFGLGRTNNYLEYFYMGFSNGETREWNGLIPNSQVIALPYPPNSPDDWELELFISPSAVIVWVVFTLGIGLLILGAQAAWFRYREHKEDKAEKQRTAHVFSFD